MQDGGEDTEGGRGRIRGESLRSKARRNLPFVWSRWWKAAAWFGGIALVLVLFPIWINRGDSEHSCGVLVFKSQGAMHCEFVGAYRDRLVAVYVAVGPCLLTGAIAIARMGNGRHRRIAVQALPLAIVVVLAAGLVGWALHNARPPALSFTPVEVEAAGEHTFVVTGTRFFHDRSVEIVRCTNEPSVRPCSVGIGADVEPVNGEFEVSITTEVPPEGMSFMAFDERGDGIVFAQPIRITSSPRRGR